MEYHAFLSYAHSDQQVAAAIQKGLQQIGRRLGQRRALRVFRDSTDLEANPDLWAKITAAIDSSDYLIVLLSPRAAASRWVNKEVSYWLEHRGREHLMLVLAEGQLHWDEAEARFDEERSDAALPVLKEPRVLPAEPLYIDVSDDGPSWDVRSPTFRDKVTALAAPIHGKPKDELAGDDLRERKRFRRLRAAAIAALAVLTVIAVVAASIAIVKTREAQREARDSLAARLDTEAAALFSGAIAGSDIRALADTLAAQRIRSDPTASRGAFYTATTALNATRVIMPTPAPVHSVAFSPDGHTLASSSADADIRLWDLTDPAHPGQPPRRHTEVVESVAFSPDGHTLASGSADADIRLWDLTDPAHPAPLGQPLHGNKGIVYSVAFSPDGHTLASGSADADIRLWDLTDPAHPSQSLQVPDAVSSHPGAVHSVAFSPDGHTLASGGDDAEVRLWDLTDRAHPRLGQPLKVPNTVSSDLGAVYCVAFSPDGHTLASGSDDADIRLWDLTDPAHPGPLGEALRGHTGIVHSVAFSPDGNTLASGGDDATVQLWDLTDPAHSPLGQPLRGHTGTVYSVAFRPDGHTLASGSTDHTVRLWNLDTALPLRGHTRMVENVAFSRNGQTLASGSNDKTVRLWDLSDPAHPAPRGQLRVTGTVSSDLGAVYSVAFSPDGHTLASGIDDGTVRLWDLTDPAHPSQLLQGHKGTVHSVAFSPDGHTLASGSDDATVRLWDLTDPAHPSQLLQGHKGAVWSVAFRDNHILASGSADHTVRLWDLTDPAQPGPLGRPLGGHTGTVWSVAFSPDGHALASGSDDADILLWDLTDPAHPARLGRPMQVIGAVYEVAFSSDGTTLASASANTTVRLYDLSDPANPARLGQPLRGHTGGVDSVAFRPDGHTLASGGDDASVRLWPTPEPVDAFRSRPPRPATVAILCSKLTSNISHQEWRDWISPSRSYDYPSPPLCPNLPVPRD